jgi:hypothetical protein
MRIDTQSSPIRLCEPPKNILGSFIDIGATSVFWKIVDKGYLGQFLLEDVDLVEE